MVCGRLARASPSPWCSSAASSGKSLRFSSLVDRRALGVEDDQAGVGGGPVRERLPQSRRSNRAAAGGTPARSAVGVRHFRFLTTGTQRRVVGVICPCLYSHPPGSHHTRLIVVSSAPLSSCHPSRLYPHCGPHGGILTSSPRRRARAACKGSSRRASSVHRVASSSSLLVATSPHLRLVIAVSLSCCPPILFQEAVRQVRDLGGRCVRAAGHEGTSCCSERQRGTSAARLSRHLDLQRL